MRARGAEISELETLYRASLPRYVRAAAAIVGDEGLGADAVQDAFVRAVRGRRAFRRQVPLEAWVWRIVINSAIDARTRNRRHLLLEKQALDILVENGHPESDATVRAWVAALPERQRLAVFLRYFADLEYQAIAAVLKIEVGTVSATLSAAHAALRRSVEEVQHS
jgi:RNA polymerase sigma-70 factor (ECF subfamily)